MAGSFTAHRENLYLNLVTSHLSRDADSKSEDDVEPRYSDLVSRALSISPFCQKPGTYFSGILEVRRGKQIFLYPSMPQLNLVTKDNFTREKQIEVY